ncbi:hypothetical protein [uncultured Sphingomonas sp.]|uniref:hypothetical protein n=1 Tax=uncultured Sphingomonas sp. TaxID=158754 RepID=UPI0030D813A2
MIAAHPLRRGVALSLLLLAPLAACVAEASAAPPSAADVMTTPVGPAPATATPVLMRQP